MADHRRSPDYDLADELELTGDEQYRALFDETRSRIVTLLLDRAATTSELAEVLERPKGTVGHHLKLLERAGLVRVVRTERVRALEAKYYGRTARLFLYHAVGEAVGEPQRALARAAAGIAAAPVLTPEAADDPGHLPVIGYLRHARIPRERASEWADRLADLVLEFAAEPAAGDTTYAVVVGLYPTRGLSDPDGTGAP
ncbi:winged helix-turn-helix domain-containing protein [Nocardioides zeae]|uniref:Winged helix-turn-helix domain-containing protein n=1 Tax=Nocardioides imazamoxiresistens TaxID=3231893 RepID=A0ABU3PZK9_9ACTN|nr:winged helix-turn-helix domain-containing protein [Nocardioides zeae]MDT9594654.1 winged helix-turn-helix domain-containing protein [Nocardioides zeae]